MSGTKQMLVEVNGQRALVDDTPNNRAYAEHAGRVVSDNVPAASDRAGLEQRMHFDPVRAGIDALPTIGGIAGGMGAAALAPTTGGASFLAEPAGSAIGQGLGQAARQGLLRGLNLPGAPQSIGDAARSVGGSALAGGALGTVSPALSLAGKAGSKVAEGMYEGALAPTKSMLRDFPDLVQYGLRDAEAPVIMQGGGRTVTSEAVGKGLGTQKQSLMDLLARETRAGSTLSRGKTVQALNRLKAEYSPANGAIGPEAVRARDAIDNFIAQFKSQVPTNDINPLLGQKIKEASADRAATLYDNAAKGIQEDVTDPILQRAHEVVADDMRNQLRSLPTHGKSIDAMNKAMKPDIGLLKALKNAEIPYNSGVSVRGRVGGVPLPMDRTTMSKAAITLDKLARAPLAARGSASMARILALGAQQPGMVPDAQAASPADETAQHYAKGGTVRARKAAPVHEWESETPEQLRARLKRMDGRSDFATNAVRHAIRLKLRGGK